MRKQRTVVLITDVDNTLYDFIDFFAPAFRGMIHVMANTLDIEEVKLHEEFRDVFRQLGTLDYQYLIRYLKSTSEFDDVKLKRQSGMDE